MEPAKADQAQSQEALREAISGLETRELQEMGVRLSRSIAGMEEMLEEAKAEQELLKEEKSNLNETITLMMKEMQKLNIGSLNTVEPTLVDDNKLAFVGRFWEKVRPRDTAYAVDEHIGEIKKPDPGQQATPTPQEVGKQVVQNTVQNVRGALGPLWQRAETLVKDTHQKVQQNLQERAAAREAAESKQRAAGKASKEPKASKKASSKQAEGQEADPAESAAAEEAAEKSKAEGGSSASAAGAAPTTAAAAGGAPAPAPAAAAAAPKAAAGGAARTEEQSTVLIEALLKIDDGSVQALHVRSSDRCKEVSRRFVQEHSLKAWFEEPLTAWLKQVESDAETFPVTVEGDLMQIRKTYSKAK